MRTVFGTFRALCGIQAVGRTRLIHWVGDPRGGVGAEKEKAAEHADRAAELRAARQRGAGRRVVHVHAYVHARQPADRRGRARPLLWCIARPVIHDVGALADHPGSAAGHHDRADLDEQQDAHDDGKDVDGR